MKVYLIEWQGCECGGLEKVAFATREAAEQWVTDNTNEYGLPKSLIHDGFEIFEVEVTE